jgi:cobalt-zinc-cadmium efflux system outer membrane protein
LWTNPNVGANVSILSNGSPQGGAQTINLVVDQVVPMGGQTTLRRDVAQALSTAQEREFAALAFTLGADIEDAYLALQLAQIRKKMLKAGLKDLDRVEGIIGERAAAGANPVYDRLRVDVERSLVAGRLSDATVDIATAQAVLAESIGPGIDPLSLVTDEVIPESPSDQLSPASLVQRALAQRQDLQAAKERLNAAQIKITQVRREYVPSPDISLGYSFWTNMPAGVDPRNGGAVYAGVSVPIPLLDHGQGRIDRAMHEAQAADLRLKSADLTVRRDVARVCAALEVRVAAWRHYRDGTAPNVEHIRSIAESAYREGRSGILELLDAYRSYLDVKERGVILQAAAYQAWLDVLRTLGPSNR